MLTIHLLENSRAQRIAWLLEELKVPYEVKHYKRDATTSLAPKSLREVHPLGKSPVLTDGDLVIAESGAIIEYLVGRYGDGGLAPEPGTPEHVDYLYWLHAAEGSVMPYLVVGLLTTRMRTNAPILIRPIAKGIAGQIRDRYVKPNLKALVSHMEKTLSQQEWFAGPAFTAADIQMAYPIEAIEARAGYVGDMPNLKAFAEKVRQRPAYQRAVERTGGFAILKG